MLIRRFLRWWDAFWFATSDRYQYGLFRMLLIAGLFGFRGDGEWGLDTFHTMQGAPAMFTTPVPLLRVLHLPVPPPSSWFVPMEWTFRLAVVMAFVGLATRPALFVLAAFNLYAEAALNSFGFIDHATTVPSIALAILAIAPGVTQWSVDELLGRWKASRSNGAADTASADSTGQTGKAGGMNTAPTDRWNRMLPVWPAHLILLMTGLAYFAAGYSKLVKSSRPWTDGQTLTSYLLDAPNAQLLMAPDGEHLKTQAARIAAAHPAYAIESFVYDTGYPTRLGRIMGGHPLAMILMSLFTLAFELGFVLTVPFPRLRPYFLLAGIGFHGGIMLTMCLYSFYSYLVCYLLFVDWRWVADRVARVDPVEYRAAVRDLVGAPLRPATLESAPTEI